MSKKVKGQKTVEKLLEEALVTDEEQPYKTPNNWVWVYTDAVNEVVTGSTPPRKKQEYYGGEFPFIKPGDLEQARNIRKATEYLTDEGKKVSRIIPKGSTLICCIGSIGKAGYSIVECSTNQQINTLVPKRVINPLYNYYQALTPYFHNTLWKNSSSTTVSIINKSRVSKIPIPLPPLNEQKRVAEKVEYLLNKIDKAKRLIDEAKESFELRRAAIMNKAFRGELTVEWRKKNPNYFFSKNSLNNIQIERKKKFEEEKGLAKKENRKVKYNKPTFLGEVDETNLPEIPDSWRYVYLGNITEVVRGGSPRPAGDPRYFGGKIPWITVAEITKDDDVYLDSVSSFVTEEGMQRSRFLEEGTLLLTNSGATLGVPKVTNIAGCINDGSVAFVELFQVSKLYLYYFLYSQTKRLRNLNQGAAQPNLNTDIVKHIVVPLPPVEEQIKIVDVLERVINLEKKSYAIVEIENKTNEIKQSILSKAFRGELGTNDPSEESAIELLKEVL